MQTNYRDAEKKAYHKFLSAGMTPEGACGLIGNLEAESGFVSGKVETLQFIRFKENEVKDRKGNWYTDETYTAEVDAGNISAEQFLHPLPGKQYGYGLAQWTSPARKAGLYNLAHRYRVSIGDSDMQIDFLIGELKESYSGVLSVLRKTHSIREASDVVLIQFEAPSDISEKVKADRCQLGQMFYEKYVKTWTSPGEKEATMPHYISNCGHDENNRATGGAAGDQGKATGVGEEWGVIPWYNRPWSCVLRHPDAEVREMHASMAEAAAKNDNIGYDQYQRDTFGVELKAAGDDPSKITKKCETDCSKGVIDITKAIGRKLGRKELENIAATYTGNMRSAFKAAGYQVLTESKYLTSPDYLLPGDILLNDVHHTATNLSKGSKASGSAVQTGTTQNAALIGTCNVQLKTFLKGAKDDQVRTIQILLSKLGFKGKDGKDLVIDGELGDNTAYAIEQFQRKQGMSGINFGTVAAKTWQLLISAK